MASMFELFGRTEKRFESAVLKRIHRANGLFFIVLAAIISYFCLDYIVNSGADLSPRGTFHSVFSLTVVILLVLKIVFLRFYRQFYGKVQTIGLIIALATFGMVGTSGGYFLLVTKLGTEARGTKDSAGRILTGAKESVLGIRTDAASIGRGKELYDSKCYSCHDPDSTETIVGPGHKGILKNPHLPVSKKAATSQNIALQIRSPYGAMPAFAYLSDEEVADLVAYMNTL